MSNNQKPKGNIVNCDAFTYQISDNKGKSREEFEKACSEGIASVHGSWRSVSKAATHAFIHAIKFGDSILIARLYGCLVNETNGKEMPKALKAAAKACCAVTITVDDSKSGKDDVDKVYKGQRNKDDWAVLWRDPKEGPAKCVEQMKKMETCIDDEITNSRQFGLGLFLEQKKNSGGTSNTTKSKYHDLGKKNADWCVKIRDLSEKLKDHPEITMKLDLFEEQMKGITGGLETLYKSAEKLLESAATASGAVNRGKSSNDDPDTEDEEEQDIAA